MEADNNDMKDFCKSYRLKSLVRVQTCSKNLKISLCIDQELLYTPLKEIKQSIL